MEKRQQELKKRAAERAVDFVQDGHIVGLGTGSTIYFALQKLGRRVAEGLNIKGVPTSKATEHIAIELKIPIVYLNDVDSIDVVIDGADEIDANFDMIKGGGGALTREKLVAIIAKRRVIVVDEGKLVPRLGEAFLLPIEILPIAWKMVCRQLESKDCQPILREHNASPFETDNGNYIVDCKFKGIEDAATLERELKLISGVVEVGLFIGLADAVVIGRSDRVEVKFKSN
jgi:ribose 5-phosphate isomerase A